jgi:hypothetical protein
VVGHDEQAVINVDGDDGQSPPHSPNIDTRVTIGGIEATQLEMLIDGLVP